MIIEQWKIRWNEYSADSYLYGSDITYHGRDGVEFKNNLMPPGTVIKQWYSKTNYQLQKIEPSLPIIDGESKYRIIINIDTPNSAGCLVKIIFYDKYNYEVGNIIIRDMEHDFVCPITTYSYKIQLINGGMKELMFHSIIIQEIEDEEE